jgi:hypothetical protein
VRLLRRRLSPLGNLIPLRYRAPNGYSNRARLGSADSPSSRNAQIRRVQPCQEILPGGSFQAASEAQSRWNKRQMDEHAGKRMPKGRANARSDSRTGKSQSWRGKTGENQRRGGNGTSLKQNSFTNTKFDLGMKNGDVKKKGG